MVTVYNTTTYDHPREHAFAVAGILVSYPADTEYWFAARFYNLPNRDGDGLVHPRTVTGAIRYALTGHI